MSGEDISGMGSILEEFNDQKNMPRDWCPKNAMIRLIELCQMAADEIEEHWEAHCDEDGYGPINLIDKLRLRSGPDYVRVLNEMEDK